MKTHIPYLLGLFLLLTSCGSKGKNHIDRIVLNPAQSKAYSFQTQTPFEIGIELAHKVDGGTVELQQLGSISEGTGYDFFSRQWQPINGHIELKLINNSKTKVEVVVFKGSRPNE